MYLSVKEQILKFLEDKLENLYDIEDMLYKQGAYSEKLSKDMSTVKKAIKLIENGL